MTESEKNLTEFYRVTGSTSMVHFTESDNYSTVKGVNGSWPQMVFQLRDSSKPGGQLVHIFGSHTETNLPDFAVCDAFELSVDDQQTLKNNGIFPVMNWTLMERRQRTQIDLTGLFPVKELTLPDELETFARLVNSEMLTSVKIKPDLLKELAKDPRMRIFGIEENKQLTSALLTFTKTGTTGLYFVVTDHTKRGEGRASALIQEVIKSSGPEKTFVLQAVSKAVPLYAKLGFITVGKLAIFWNTKTVK